MAKIRRRYSWDYEKFIDDAGVVWKVHKRLVCAGTFCAIHNPSDHPLKTAKIILRTDGFKYGFVERICAHGIGHSDPDSTRYFESIGKLGMDVHGCDGCC